MDAGSSGDSTISIFNFLVLCVVEIKSASIDCSRDQDKIENGIPVVSVSNRGKRIVNYGTSTRTPPNGMTLEFRNSAVSEFEGRRQ